jgi:hypothetical protein
MCVVIRRIRRMVTWCQLTSGHMVHAVVEYSDLIDARCIVARSLNGALKAHNSLVIPTCAQSPASSVVVSSCSKKNSHRYRRYFDFRRCRWVFF